MPPRHLRKTKSSSRRPLVIVMTLVLLLVAAAVFYTFYRQSVASPDSPPTPSPNQSSRVPSPDELIAPALAYDKGIHFRCTPANREAKALADLTPNPNRNTIIDLTSAKNAKIKGDELLVAVATLYDKPSDVVTGYEFTLQTANPDIRLFNVYRQSAQGTWELATPARGQSVIRVSPQDAINYPIWVVAGTSAKQPCDLPDAAIPFVWRDVEDGSGLTIPAYSRP